MFYEKNNKPIAKKVTKSVKNDMKKKVSKENTSKKKNKAFTLIELLAVIIILGILMIIAIPSVTTYISNSRKSAYVNTAKEIVSGTRNLVNEGKLEMYDSNTTYYIPVSCIKTENGSKTPYGEFETDGAYVGVTFDGNGYSYYWISNDTSGQGVKVLTPVNELDEDDIDSGIQSGEIKEIVQTTGIDGKNNILIYNSDCTGTTSGSGANQSNKICKRAETLHTATCSRTSNGCRGNNKYANGDTITYGNLGTSGTLSSGDAFDCDVNNDGVWDSATERFYYVTDEGENAVLIYYTNMNDLTPYEYYSINQNWHGPRTAYQYLPSTSTWSNPGLIAPGTRSIVAENGATSTSGGTIESFTYTNKAARLLTAQEVNAACGITVGSWTSGELEGCNWLMENIGFYEKDSGTRRYGYWLESPRASNSNTAWYVDGSGRSVNSIIADDERHIGVRPAIKVLKSNIDY